MNWVRGAGPAPRGFVGHREGFIDLIPGLLGQLRKFAGEAQCWFCETAFSHHLLFQPRLDFLGWLKRPGEFSFSLHLFLVPLI